MKSQISPQVTNKPVFRLVHERQVTNLSTTLQKPSFVLNDKNENLFPFLNKAKPVSMSVCSLWTYIRDEGCLQHAGLQPFEVDGAEDGMSFDLSGSAPQAAQPLGGIFGQQLRG